MLTDTDILENLPIAVYATDAEGRITFYNDAAAAIWGHRPEFGSARWCGSWRLFWPDGRPMPHDDCPMAVTLREGRPVNGIEAVAERPDGRRISFLPFPSLVRDASGAISGAINALVEVTDRTRAELDLARLAAIVASSDDAIISKTLDGTVMSWNAGASRIFGYAPEEMIGQPIVRIIPPELRHEEEGILGAAAARRAGRSLRHRAVGEGRPPGLHLADGVADPQRRRRRGRRLEGRPRRQRAQAQRGFAALAGGELNHRVKNTLATIQAIARQSLRTQPSPRRSSPASPAASRRWPAPTTCSSGARCSGPSSPTWCASRSTWRRRSAHRLVGPGSDPRFAHCGSDGPGAARARDQRPQVRGAVGLDRAAVDRVEPGRTARARSAHRVARGRRAVGQRADDPGLRHPADRAVAGREQRRGADPLSGRRARLRIRLPLPADPQPDLLRAAAGSETRRMPPEEAAAGVAGRRVLVIEDEALIALDIEDKLFAAGCEVVGPAASLETARRLLAEATVDCALLDANLVGRPVDELAGELTRRGIPFAFATGYGRQALPEGFRDAPLLAKPFDTHQLVDTVRALLVGRGATTGSRPAPTAAELGAGGGRSAAGLRRGERGLPLLLLRFHVHFDVRRGGAAVAVAAEHLAQSLDARVGAGDVPRCSSAAPGGCATRRWCPRGRRRRCRSG